MERNYVTVAICIISQFVLFAISPEQSAAWSRSTVAPPEGGGRWGKLPPPMGVRKDR